MLTYVYMGSVGPFENVYVNKKKGTFQVIQSKADKLPTIK